MLERDFAVARITPGRRSAVLVANGVPVGVLDWLERHPTDRLPWIGLVMVAAERQRAGLATEAVGGLVELFRDGGAAAVRTSLVERNEPARALAARLGFVQVDARPARAVAVETVLVLERRLDAAT